MKRLSRKTAWKKLAPEDFDFKEFMKGLASLQKVPLCTGCLKGGGNSNCTIRICAKEKKMSNCNQCELVAPCKNFEMLEKSNPNVRKDLLKNKNTSQRELIAKWKTELRGKFPHCLVLCNPE